MHEPRGRVTLLVDFLTDPADEAGLETLLRWVDREARQADSDKIRAFAMHAGFRKVLKRSGYFQVKSDMEFVLKVNGIDVPPRVLRRHEHVARDAGRFRPGPMNVPVTLLVGIDTEGDNQWDAAARLDQRFENIYALPRLHALFAQHGVRPTYVITHPVATDERSVEVLRRLQDGGDCEIGAHHHTWETPPCSDGRHPGATRTPRRCRCAQFAAQLEALTEAIERAVGRRPVSYRSGRFGFSADHVNGARTMRIPCRIERHPAVLRSSQGRP